MVSNGISTLVDRCCVCDLGFSTDVQLQPVCSVFVLSHSHYAAVIHTSVVFACSRS